MQEYQLLQSATINNQSLIIELQRIIVEKDRKIEELLKSNETLLTNNKTNINNPEPLEKEPTTPELKPGSPGQYSITSNHEQNINFIDNGIIEQVAPLENVPNFCFFLLFSLEKRTRRNPSEKA